MRRWQAVTLAISVGIVLGLGGLRVVRPHLPSHPLVRGLLVDGQPLPRGERLRSWLAQRDQAVRGRRVVLRHGEHQFETTFGQIGGRLDAKAALREARAVGHTGSIVRRLRETARARKGQIDVPLRYVLDDVVALELIQGFAKPLRREPTDARLDLANHRKVPDQAGQRLDAAASVRALREELVNALGGEKLSLVTEPIAAKITLNDLADIDVSKTLASFETRYQIFKRGRSRNVELAASKLDGLLLPPGLIISFNGRVGARTPENGFQKAPEIVGDELTIGIGGGTCQVSSTLHGAALYGGLDIVQRKSHSRPSSYTKLGLDATVAYGAVDLRLRNPHKFGLVIHAFTPKPGTLRVELLGGEAVDRVEYKYGVANIEKYQRRITEKSWMKPGRAFRKQKGTRGMDVHSFVAIHFKDGRVEKRQYYSGYRATPEVYWVAPGYKPSELPDLPQHAKGVEGEPEDIYDG